MASASTTPTWERGRFPAGRRAGIGTVQRCGDWIATAFFTRRAKSGTAGGDAQDSQSPYTLQVELHPLGWVSISSLVVSVKLRLAFQCREGAVPEADARLDSQKGRRFSFRLFRGIIADKFIHHA